MSQCEQVNIEETMAIASGVYTDNRHKIKSAAFIHDMNGPNTKITPPKTSQAHF